MKKIYFVQIFILIYSFCFSQNIDEIKGFKSGIFGMSAEKLNSKKIVYESEISKTYKNENEDLKFGEYSFFQIDYAFYENKLWKISAHCSGSENILGILKMLYKSYGNCKTEKFSDKKDVIQYFWEGKNISVSMITFDDFTAAKLVIIDKTLENSVINGFKDLKINSEHFEKIIEKEGKQ